MKLAISIMKGLQTGGIFGSGVVLMLGGQPGGRNPELVSFETLALGFIATALVSSLCLGLMGQRERAWKGAVLTIVLVLLVGGLTAPMVIR